MKKICKQCGKRFEDGTHSFHCPICRKFNSARCETSKPKQIPMPGEIHFHVIPSYTTIAEELKFDDNKVLNGFCVLKKKDNTSAVHVNLFNCNSIRQIIDVIIHEFFFHKVLFDIGEIEAGEKGDCELMKKLEKWLLSDF